MSRARTLFLFIGLTTACGPTLSSTTESTAAAPQEATIGAPAPAFSLTDTDGQTVSLADFKGQTVAIEWFNPD